jgi:hypothetical protein
MQLIVLRRKCTGLKPWILLVEGLRSEYFFTLEYIRKPWDYQYSKIQDVRKRPFLTSLHTARRPDAKTLIRDAGNLLVEELEPAQGPSKSMGVLGV